MTPPAPPKPPTPEQFYDIWRSDPTPDNLNKVVRALEPAIVYKLSAVGGNDSPQLKHQARLYTAEAVQRFKPDSGTSLHTWTVNHLQGLQRFKRENQGPVKIPDRAAVDAWAIEKANRELEDELGFEPDVQQLADGSGMSVQRISKVRQITRPVAASAQMFDEGSTMTDYLGEALDYVYGDSDSIDRKIIEYTTGYGGVAVLNKKEIAARVGLSPAQVTRRSERIGRKLVEMDSALESNYQ